MCDNSRIFNNKKHFICLNCRKGFKKHTSNSKHLADNRNEVSKNCPQCGLEMQGVSVDFRIPNKNSLIWKKLKKGEISPNAVSSCSCCRNGMGKTRSLTTGYKTNNPDSYQPNFNRKRRLKNTHSNLQNQRDAMFYQEILDVLKGVDLDILTLPELREKLIQHFQEDSKMKLIKFWKYINDISLVESKTEVEKIY